MGSHGSSCRLTRGKPTIYSRNEFHQVAMGRLFSDPRLRFPVGEEP